MKTGTDALETWIPHAGFRLEHRKGKTPDGAILTTDWLVPASPDDDISAAHPCAEQPCLHRMLAECIWHREIRALRNTTALWDAIAGRDEAALRRALPQHQEAKGKELFRLAREHLARRVTEKMAGGRFELVAPEGDGPSQLIICYRTLRLTVHRVRDRREAYR